MAVLPTHAGARAFRPYPAVGGGPWDAIVIGSGMGGMSCAAALARYGRRVLVLEQHYVPGGYTHMFSRKGFHWDVGVHAIGEMGERDLPARMLRWLTGGGVEMVSLGNPYDRFRLPGDFEIGFPDSKAAFVAELEARFPDEVPRIRRYVKAVGKAAGYAMAFFAFKSFPEALERWGNRLVHLVHRDWWATTTAEVLDELGIHGRLRTALTVQWGYIGSIPSESSFAVHALTHTHFWNGGYYPRGGSKVLAERLLGAVLEAGGEVVSRASVAEVLVERGRAAGVRMADGRELRAPAVISAAGAKTTVNALVPAEYRESEWAAAIRAVPDSPSYIGLNLGFEGDVRAAGASPANLWLYSSWDNEQTVWDPSDPGARPHILYISFPSLKGPDHVEGERRRHTGECITFVPWDLFARWEDTDLRTRPEAYRELKEDIEERLLAELREALPELMSMLVHAELSTPLTAQHFARASRGAIYGLAATPARFRCAALRTRTPIRGFYMTGVDVASLGVVGAMTSGMLTAAALEKRVYLKLL